MVFFAGGNPYSVGLCAVFLFSDNQKYFTAGINGMAPEHGFYRHFAPVERGEQVENKIKGDFLFDQNLIIALALSRRLVR